MQHLGNRQDRATVLIAHYYIWHDAIALMTLLRDGRSSGDRHGDGTRDLGAIGNRWLQTRPKITPPHGPATNKLAVFIPSFLFD
ncbi:hypothetical protein HNQ59_000861 [Chitinivorax tropicus]|uniref:Uncharacterized protein n=1 Tax=Chitinivorax tropicus TaxID=714531 RepID=A0A840MLK5_9PROT|nr:hypothetical protein [Chitinivorax tropicus]MBB5017592.1 hypothetical protein [Chitinivorax tropicus]